MHSLSTINPVRYSPFDVPGDQKGKRLESVFIVVALLFFSEAFLSLIANPDLQEDFSSENDLLLIAIQTVLYALLIGFCIFNWEAFKRVARREASAWLLSGLAVASGLWSADPVLNSRRGLILVGTTAFGVYIAARFSLKEQLRILSLTLAIAGLLSILMVAFFPHYGIMPAGETSGWRGIFPHKNPFGRIMALAALVFLVRARATVRHRLVLGFGFLTAMILTLLSQSVTAILVSVVLFITVPLLNAMRRSVKLTTTVLATVPTAILAVGIIVTLYEGTLFRLVGKDSTLTGRTYLWSLVVEKIAARPILGYGIVGFWQGMNGESESICRALGWIPPSAHNGILDLWLSLGAVGVSIFLIGYVLGLSRAIQLLRSDPAPEAVWPLAYMLYYLLCNIDESALLQHNPIYWVLYVVALFSVCKTHTKQISRYQP
jgi:O-antigen ligase